MTEAALDGLEQTADLDKVRWYFDLDELVVLLDSAVGFAV